MEDMVNDSTPLIYLIDDVDAVVSILLDKLALGDVCAVPQLKKLVAVVYGDRGLALQDNKSDCRQNQRINNQVLSSSAREKLSYIRKYKQGRSTSINSGMQITI